jgi:hypothetical protein
MKITTVSLLKNTPLNTWWKSASFFVNNTLWKENDLLFLYFHKEENQQWVIPKIITFKTKYINKVLKFSWLPDLLQKMNFEFLFSRWELKNIKTDVVLLEFPYLYHIAKIISHYNNNCQIVMMAHNIEHQYYKREWSKVWWLIKLYEDYVLKRVNKIICISQHDYEYIKRINKNVELIKLWVSSEIYTNDGDAHNFDNWKFNILFYWSLKLQFNKEALNFVYNELCPKLSNEYQINVCWKNIDGLPNKDNLKFQWFVEKIEDYIRWSDAVVVPINQTVGVNMRILESLYCWKIVLTTPACLKWLDKDLRDAVLVCKNVEDYIKILGKLQKDKKYKLECESKVKHVINKYTKDWEEILNNIFGKAV